MKTPEIIGGNGEREAAGHTAPKTHKSLSDRMWDVAMIAGPTLAVATGVGGFYKAMTEEPRYTRFGNLTPEGAVEVIVVNQPIEAKCQEIGKSVSIDLRRDERGNAVAVFDCKAIEAAK
jgi:hypothetical protein